MASEGTERRLAAIMFTDIVGSTAATARSEAAGLELRDRHRRLVRAQVDRYHGRFIEAPGDESLHLTSYLQGRGSTPTSQLSLALGGLSLPPSAPGRRFSRRRFSTCLIGFRSENPVCDGADAVPDLL